MFNQLSDHFETIFNTHLAAFRKSFGCQTTLLRLLEDWKRDLDNHRYVEAILMDLSKAFDCLPHDLIIEKLAAYGLSDSACSLLQSYLSDRKQMVKLGQCKSTFLSIIKGVPQGSILGPLLFNVFLNDIFYLSRNLASATMQTIIPLLTVTLTLLKPRGYLHPKVKMSYSGLILATCRPILENSRPFSWVKEGTVTVRVSQSKIIMFNVKIQSNYWMLLLIIC